MRAGGVLVVLLGACAVGEPVIDWSYGYDPACRTPSDVEREAVASGFDAWTEWGVAITQAPAPDVELCLADGRPHDHAAWTHDGRITFGAIPGDLLAAVAQHEAGHIVLAHPHLAEDECGVLSAVLCATAWSDDDVAHLESSGLRRVIPVDLETAARGRGTSPLQGQHE